MRGRENKRIGKIGEEMAARFLKERGCDILGRNVRTPFGEIDLVARKDGIAIFVEVKTRSSPSLGPPYLSITWLKKKHLVRNALWYLKRYGLSGTDWRIDVASIKLNARLGPESIELIENAVEDNG
ncbi:MAG: YraN family protein [Candidatus Omnitrophica bacterium]|nr:YraN family protein [Candidatus Omnitrophota bacterium]